ncbi:MAG: Zn-dependent alcohol dehydrogenase [Verrucomicrobia bacterium]|nr:MAG: Zn-dependent alcohol dehydrogenase [Verrucomicrobiota bacterium]
MFDVFLAPHSVSSCSILMSALPKTMRAVVYRGAKDLRVETLPVPRIGASELLVKVAACGVCPTDIKKIEYGTVPPPRVFGHETAGTIVRVGARVRGFRAGERVALHHHVPCLDCHFCRHHAFAQCATYKRTGITAGFEPAGGGYAEYVRVLPFALPGVVKIPAKNSFEEGAMLEPVNTVLKAVRRLALQRGDVVLVAGQGPIGLMFTRLLQLEGAQVLATDLLNSRLKLARKFGARFTQNASRAKLSTHNSQLSTLVSRVTKHRGLDAAIIAVPSDAVALEAQSLLRGGGQLMLFAHTKRGDAFTLDPASVCVDEKDLLGSYSADFTLQREVARLVFSRKLDVRPLITHRFPLEKTADAIALASRPTEDSLKIVVSQD